MIMKKEIEISVIIPVYNAQEYIDRAVKSVLCQMDGSIELILVDDGSKDRSGDICDEYAKKYDNIRVIHKENGGTSSAKNMGIQIASGKYISFMDSDDYLEKNAYAEIRKVIAQYSPDCIDFGWRYIQDNEPMAPEFHKLPKNILLEESVLTELIFPPLLNLRWDPDHFIFDFCCNKVFRAEIIHAHDLLFDVDKQVWEDRTFLLRCLKHSKNYYAMDACFYNYVIIPESLSKRYTVDFFRIIIENFYHYKELYMEQFDFDTEYANGHWCHAIENMIFHSLTQADGKEKIRQTIIHTLADQQVIHWYEHRKPKNKFEQKVSGLVISGQYEKALTAYTKYQKKKTNKQKIHSLLSSTKRCLKRLIAN